MRIQRLWRDWRGFFIFLALMLLFRSAVADWYVVPTGSMKPTIVEGDRIFVNKMAYDVRVPFTHISLYRVDDPKRGDIVVFDSERAGKRLVKRVIGEPGDVVWMDRNRLFVNGQQAAYRFVSEPEVEMGAVVYEEVLQGLSHAMAVDPYQKSPLQSFAPVVVPEGQYLVLGDNRDNSADSRVYGFVDRDSVLGRSSAVLVSLDYENYFLPRSERFFQGLD